MRVNSIRNLVFGVTLVSGLMATNCLSAYAVVVESSPDGFVIQETAHIKATPDAVYAALTHPEKWWNSEHTFSGNAANLSLDEKAGGCLCETLPNGGSVQHLSVVYAAPGQILRLKGAMGPFQGQGVDGALTFTLKPEDGGTDIVLDNVYGGYIKGGIQKWPQAADMMLSDLIAHLKYFSQTGTAMKSDTK